MISKRGQKRSCSSFVAVVMMIILQHVMFVTCFDNIGPHRQGSSDPPQQIHLSLSGVAGEMVVTWISEDLTPQSIVEYGTKATSLLQNATGSNYLFTDGGDLKTNRSIHNVLITNLQPNTRYYYRCGDPVYSWSEIYSFKTMENGDQVLRMALYGDFGDVNAVSLTTLQTEIQEDNIDLVVHIGDFAYNLDSENGHVGDVFMNEIQPIAGYVPYMGCPGNHEEAYNFTHYTNRFSGLEFAAKNSESPINWYYSWDIVSGNARIHFVAISTELYFYIRDYDLFEALQLQYRWLENDLSKAKNGGADWIFVYGHRPLYCSQKYEGNCREASRYLRDGIDGQFGLEVLLHNYDVDIYFTAHEHAYERTWPVYNSTFVTYNDSNVYVNPIYTTHIVTGSAGCQEGHDFFIPGLHGKWSNFRSASFGYGHLQVFNSTHLYWDQLLNEGKWGTDYLWIIKDA